MDSALRYPSDSLSNQSLKTKAFLVGFFGDIGLQTISNQRGNIAGLKPYFEKHGSHESALIAAGLMFLWAWIWELSGLPQNNFLLFLYGGVLDILYRNLNLMPSLEHTYYDAMDPISSFAWGGLPFVFANLL